MIAAIVILAVGTILAALQWNNFTRRDRDLALISFAAHITFAFLQTWLQEVYYRGVSDATGYLNVGEQLARTMDADFSRFAPEVGKLILQQPNIFPSEIGGDGGSSTTTMNGIAAPIEFLFGKSLLAACLVTALIGWFAKLFLYRVARDAVRESEQRTVAFAVLLMPSVVFWCSGFNKEALALSGLAVATFGLHRTIAHGSIRYALLIPIGLVTVAILKPYILFPFSLAAAAWVYVARLPEGATARLRPGYLILAAGVAIGGIVLMGKLFPEFAPDKIAESAAQQQANWRGTEGGSNIDFGSGEARTPLEQLPFAPLALANALYRPLLFEAKNPPMFGAALETTGLGLLTLALLRRVRFSRIRDAIFSSPLLAFSVVFVFTFGVAVGLASSNLGSLSRYRMPMIPMYASLLLVLRLRLMRSADRDVPVTPARLARGHGARATGR